MSESMRVEKISIEGDWSPLWEKIHTKSGGAEFEWDAQVLEITTTNDGETIRNSEASFVFNHFAVAVPGIDACIDVWRRKTGVFEALRVRGGFDPIANGPLDTAHFYIQNRLYVTLREEGTNEQLHHIGWEVKSMQDIDHVRSVLKEIGWNIFWEGEIDQSYVLHFEGPDGRIHDFFCTNIELKTGRNALNDTIHR